MEDLKTICHLDGRNRKKVEPLRRYFSEYALIRYRLFVEIRYLKAVEKILRLRKLTQRQKIEDLLKKFDEKEAQKIRLLEKKLNHDVKAVEYYLKAKTKTELTHFAVASEDINNLAYALLVQDAVSEVFLPYLSELIRQIETKGDQYRNIVMLARTHGQPASPTSLGKEFAVFANRLKSETEPLKNFKASGKLSGASGNYNSFFFAQPLINWKVFAKKFVESLGLNWSPITTQIAPYEPYIRLFDSVKRINNILLDMTIDLWYYISLGYFKQQRRTREVGSSAMPHKINPITFEAAEGNLGFANSMFEYFARKLPLNRLQRDLSDSTIRRNFGLAFAYSMFAYESLLDGLSRITPDQKIITNDLESHYEVLMEAVQNYLRIRGYTKPYERLKKKSHGKVMTKQEYRSLIKDLNLRPSEEKHLLLLEPKTYTGYSTQRT